MSEKTDAPVEKPDDYKQLLKQSFSAIGSGKEGPDPEGLKKLRDRQQREGRIVGAGAMMAKVTFWASVFALVVVSFLAIVVLSTEWGQTTLARVITGLAMLMALTFCFNSLRDARAAGKRGPSVLTIDQPPVHAGELLRGNIRIHLGPDPERVTLSLVCERIQTFRDPQERRGRRDKNVQSRKRITSLWKANHEIDAGDLIAEDDQHWRLPIAFNLPADARPSDDSNPKDKIQWSLRLDALRQNGERQHDGFEVRVLPAGNGTDRGQG